MRVTGYDRHDSPATVGTSRSGSKAEKVRTGGEPRVYTGVIPEAAAIGGKASEGVRRREAFGDEQNPANPRAGSVLQHTRSPGEEKTVEVARNHEDGTRSGGGSPFPVEATTSSPRVDSSGRTLGGRAFFEESAGSVVRPPARAGPCRAGQPGATIGWSSSTNGSTRPGVVGTATCKSCHLPPRGPSNRGCLDLGRGRRSKEGRRRSQTRQPREGELRSHR